METPTISVQSKVCLVTGATSGIGAVAVRELARLGATVVLVGRDPQKAAAAVAQIRAQTGNPNVEALLADLSSQRQVRELASQFLQRHQRLDVLVNNAGGIWMRRQDTVDGLEMTFAVNHLAYFLLTHLLLDALRSSPSARVVNVASRAHQRAALDFDDLMGRQRYNGWRAYCRSKLANLLFTYELARRLEGTSVTVNALHPGWVATGFGGNNGWLGRLYRLLARCLTIGPEKGARTVVYLASSPEVAGINGRYFVRERPVPSSPASCDVADARRLWRISLELTGLPVESSPSPGGPCASGSA
jgi:NAD(P)-dependent dehydrogenase (short-subunit alcohol dehydrogenase family)